MIKICVDCRPLSHPYSGIGKYTEELLIRLIKEPEFHWIFVVTAEYQPRFDTSKNVQLIRSPFKSRVLTTAWYHLVLPKQIGKTIDLFWSPRHHLPILLNKKYKSLLTIHDFTWIFEKQTMRFGNYISEKIFMSESIKKASKIVCVSNSTKNQLISYYPFATEKAEVIYCGANKVEPKPFTDARTPLETFFLFVGSIEPRKNLERVLEAYGKLTLTLRRKFPLIIVCNASWKIKLSTLIEEQKINDNCICLSNLSEGQLSYLYKQTTALIMPSLYEGFGLPVAEAIAMDSPVITSNGSSMAEIADKAAILVNPKNVDEIKNAMQLIAIDDELRIQLKEARAHLRNRFSWEKSAKEMYNLILGMTYDNLDS